MGHWLLDIAGAVDLGAMWIHEAGPSNPLYPLVQQYGLNVTQLVNYNSGAVYNEQGNRSSLFPYVVSLPSSRHLTHRGKGCNVTDIIEIKPAAVVGNSKGHRMAEFQLYV